MGKINPWQILTAKMKANKKFEIGVYVGIGLLVVMLYLTGIQPSKPDNAPTAAPSAPAAPDERGEEARLKEALSKIRGAGAVEVMLTYENGKELVPAYETDTQSSAQSGEIVSSNASTRPVTVTKGGQEEAIIVKEVEPRIRGVIVIAEGAEDIGVRMDLARAASKALGVEAERVEVFTMERQANERGR